MSAFLVAPKFRIDAFAENLTEVIDWGLNLLGIPDIWATTMGKDITVCVLDTGIDDHPDLEGAIVATKDFTNSRFSSLDINGHGTHCTGIIAARANGFGLRGIAPECKVIVGKVLGDNKIGTVDALVEGIKWAITQNADIISMSLGTFTDTPELKKAIKDAFDKGIILVGASGNEGRRDFVMFPARYPECIAVGSIDRNKVRSFFSNGGEELDIMAPGEKVFSTYKGGIYTRLRGTSMATPFVAGVCALILAKHRMSAGTTPIRNSKDMREHLTKNADDLGTLGLDVENGFGLINPKKSFADPFVHRTPLRPELLTLHSHSEYIYIRERQNGVDHYTALVKSLTVYSNGVNGNGGYPVTNDE